MCFSCCFDCEDRDGLLTSRESSVASILIMAMLRAYFFFFLIHCVNRSSIGVFLALLIPIALEGGPDTEF